MNTTNASERLSANSSLELLSIVPILAAFCYGIGWTFFSSLFGVIGVTPEDAGISVQFMVVRSAIPGSIALLAVFAIATIGLPRILRDGKAGRMLPFRLGFIAAMLFFLVVMTVALYSLVHFHHRDFNRAVLGATAFLISFAATAFLSSLVLRAVDYRIAGKGTSLHRHQFEVRHLTPPLLGIAVLLFVGVATAGTAIGGSISRGIPLETYILTVPRVQVIGPAAINTTTSSCYFLRLGLNGGNALLYAPASKKVIEFSLSSNIIVQPQHLEDEPPC